MIYIFEKVGRCPGRGVILFVLFAVFFLPPLPPAFAQAPGVTVTPQRLVFEGRSRTDQLTLINSSNNPTSYRISFKNMRMKEDGSVETIEEPGPGELFSDKLIRYSPREVTVPGGGTQTVRLMVRKPRDLPEGEYRSHMVFTALPPADAGANIEPTTVKEGRIQVTLRAIFSLTIPVIVRHGKLSADIELSDLSILPSREPGKPARLSVNISRKGNQSVYGDATVIFKPKVGEELEIGLIRGIAVYVPLAKRSFLVPLIPPEGVELKTGTLQLIFRDRVEIGSKILAEAELELP